ncbi:hypothetical protein [Streptomyces flavidovirens]|uniref:hypothetical protein n=1 Tax=Streptomyces flavidovirens TaxID=67298 RepID=UPI0036BEE9B1
MLADLITILNRAAELTLLYGPDPEGCIRAAVYGRPDVTLPFDDTTDSLLVEESVDAVTVWINPDSPGADEDVPLDEWATGCTVADVRGALYGAVAGIEAGVL